MNYEAVLFDKKGNRIDAFDFYSEKSILARDHAEHVMKSTDNCYFIQYRKIGNSNWRIVKHNVIP